MSKRMKDVQLISELFLVLIDNEIVGFDQEYLDKRYAELDSIEEDSNFLDIDEFNTRKNNLKKYLFEMETSHKAISVYAKTANNIYSLWSYLALNEINLAPRPFAEKYIKFMDQVNEFSKSSSPEELNKDKNSPFSEAAYLYFKNSRGASTDYFQRKERLTQLEKALTL